MSNLITNWNFNGNSIRMIEFGDTPYFIGKDVAEILGYAKPRNAIANHVEIDDKKDALIQGDLGGKQTMTVINESGLYSLILGSKLPTAKDFKHWITNEVLPTIRKTGGYIANDDLFVNTYLPFADENTKNLFRLQLATITQLNGKIKADKPLVDFAKQVSDTKDLIDMASFAKLLNKQGVRIGRNKLFEWLRTNKFLRYNNEPYQKYIDNGYFRVKEYTYIQNGENKIGMKTYVAGAGQRYLFGKLSEDIG